MSKNDANNNDQALSDKERAGLDYLLRAGRYSGIHPDDQPDKGK